MFSGIWSKEFEIFFLGGGDSVKTLILSPVLNSDLVPASGRRRKPMKAQFEQLFFTA